MKTAVITFTYNENINLPIWIRYYGRNFRAHNLFVADRGSNDGSVEDLASVNVIRLPRNEFDEHHKTDFISSFHRSLLNFYETVIITDCDELIVPDPDLFPNLKEYVEQLQFDYVNCVGIDILHIIDREIPLDLKEPILSQRSFGRFHSPECKPLIAKVPMNWLPGFHSSNKPPNFDQRLFLFHTKLMDYNIAMARQQINRGTVWSERSLSFNFGAHHRFDHAKFVRNGFLAPMDIVNRGDVGEFSFEKELELLVSGTVEQGGFYHIPLKEPHAKIVGLPERFRDLV